ncbi:dynamin family protein [Streptomyces sp. NPDC002889]|uniref:dynamin family protein n=1 Tax=Streptomyces sp. NPDC002889 TaxID=3364669 RepID=UPI0036CC5E03
MNPTPHPLQAEVLRLAEDSAALLDRVASRRHPTPPGTPAIEPGPDGDHGYVTPPGTADAIRAEAAAVHAGAATLVVVGEKKRGKSRLLNALVGRPGLVPVEVDVATGVHIVVRHAERPEAVAYLDGGAQRLPIRIEEIAEYAAVDPVTQGARRDDVHHVEVGIPAERLASGLCFMDTPGVGGLVSGHARITMAALGRADALIFVVNGSTELTASELRFLEQATERISEVLFVLTQTDKYRAWPEVLDRNRVLLARHAPRYVAAPWFPVSSRAEEDAQAAASAGDEETAAKRRAASGFAPLIETLTGRIAPRAAELRLANIVHVTRAALTPLAAAQDRRLRSLAQDPTLVGEIQHRREAVRSLQSTDAAWRGMLRKAALELERRLRTGFLRDVNDLRQLAEEKTASLSGPELAAELPRDLEAGAEAVWMNLEDATRKGTAQLAALMEHECGIDPDGIPEELARPERLDALPHLVRTEHDAGGVLGLVERVMPAWSAGGLTATVAYVATGGLLLPLAAGFGMIGVLSRRRRRREELTRLRGDTNRYAQRLIAELTTEIPPEITRTVEEVTARLTTRLAERISAQRSLLETELEELQRNLTASREQLAQDRERTRRLNAAVAALLDRARDLAGKLAGPERQSDADPTGEPA